MIFLMLFIGGSILTGQMLQPPESSPDVPKPLTERDTMLYQYKFFPGDTLYYFNLATDSIIVNYAPALTKARQEMYKVWCSGVDTLYPEVPDSVNPDSARPIRLMHMRVQLLEMQSKEKIVDRDTVSTRNVSPWEGRISGFTVDSSGRRYGEPYFDRQFTAGISPRGPFAPEFFPFMGGGKRLENVTWLMKDTLSMPENSAPAAIIYATSLVRAQPKIDTLGVLCSAFRFARAGQGTYYLETDREFIHNTSVLNSGVYMKLHSIEFVPVHMFSTMEQKITVHGKEEGDQTPVRHYLTSDMILDKLVPSPMREKMHKEAAEKEMNEAPDTGTKK